MFCPSKIRKRIMKQNFFRNLAVATSVSIFVFLASILPVQSWEHCRVQPPPELRPYYVAAANAYPHGLTACELAMQGQAESGFDIHAESPAGALGVAEFLPSTAADLHIDPWDPEEAIMGQAKYMNSLLGQWRHIGGRLRCDRIALALAAYNAGLGTVLASQRKYQWVLWIDAREHLPIETQNYVAKILK